MAILKPVRNLGNSGFNKLVEVGLSECLRQSGFPSAGLVAHQRQITLHKPPYLSAILHLQIPRGVQQHMFVPKTSETHS